MKCRFPLVLSALLTATSVTTMAQSVEDTINEALLAAPEPLRAGATVIVRDDEGHPRVIREGTISLVCEPDGPQPGFGVECYHKSFQGVMDWTYQRLAQGARTYREAYADGGPDVDISPGAVQYALIGPSQEEAVPTMSIKLPYATAESTGLSIEERADGPWLMWANSPAAHVMFTTKPPGVPDDYPGR